MHGMMTGKEAGTDDIIAILVSQAHSGTEIAWPWKVAAKHEAQRNHWRLCDQCSTKKREAMGSVQSSSR